MTAPRIGNRAVGDNRAVLYNPGLVFHRLVMRSLVLALCVLCLSAPLAARKPHPAVPKSNPGAWVLADDYPASALRAEVQGVVRFTLTIDANGKPRSCTVTGSSGSSLLDNVACAKIKERGEFIPATDPKGRAVEGTWSNSVRWQIPTVSAAPPPAYFDGSYIVETDGSVSHCSVGRVEPENEGAENSFCSQSTEFEPILGKDGKPVRTRVRVLMRVTHQELAD
jgi:protein TonB